MTDAVAELLTAVLVCVTLLAVWALTLWRWDRQGRWHHEQLMAKQAVEADNAAHRRLMEQMHAERELEMATPRVRELEAATRRDQAAEGRAKAELAQGQWMQARFQFTPVPGRRGG
jgi:hypothetical protein